MNGGTRHYNFVGMKDPAYHADTGKRRTSPAEVDLMVYQQPGSGQEGPQSGSDFGRIFSITLKVILALVLISALGGFIFLILGGIGKVTTSSSSEADYKALEKKATYEQTDNEHTLLPASEWNKLVAAAAKVHCPVEGMTKEEVEQVAGKPAASEPGSFRYERKISQPCTKFAGDNCAEPTDQVESETLSFTPSGHLIYELRSQRGGNWLESQCFSEPFYTKYYKPLSDKSLQRSEEQLKRSEEELNKSMRESERK